MEIIGWIAQGFSWIAHIFFILTAAIPALYISFPDYFPKIALDIPIPHVVEFLPEPVFSSQSTQINPITNLPDPPQFFTLQQLKDAVKKYGIHAKSDLLPGIPSI